MSLLASPSPHPLTAEQQLAVAVAERVARVRRELIARLRMLSRVRRACADAYYGAGLATANAIWAAHADGGRALVSRDLAERAQNAADLADLHPTRDEMSDDEILWLTCSPVPSDMDLIPLDAAGQPAADLAAAVRMTVVAAARPPAAS